MSFSTPPGGVPAARSSVQSVGPASSRARLWTETADPLDVDLSDLYDHDLREEVVDVDRDGVEVLALDDDGPRFRLPTPRPPPRHSMPSSASIPTQSSHARLPPVAPVPVKAPASVAPVSMDTVTLVAAGRPRPLTGRPSLRWAAALMVVGAAGGFLASTLTRPAAALAPPAAAAAPAAPAPEPESNFAAAERAPDTNTLSFETPLDIRIPTAEQNRQPVRPEPEPEKAKQPKVEAKRKVAVAAPAAPVRAIAQKPAFEASSRITAKPSDTVRRNLANATPEAVDALVREQLSSALR